MKAFISLFTFVITTIVISPQLFAQSNNSIILIDGVPNEVVLGSDGTILQVIKELPNYMSEYDDSKIYKKPVQRNYAPSDDLASYGISVSNNGYNPNEIFKVIYFKSGKALFSDATVEKLNHIAAEAKRTSGLIMLSTQFSSVIQGCSKKLTDNRVKACIDYLTLKGIDRSRIAQSVSESTRGSAKIEVYIK